MDAIEMRHCYLLARWGSATKGIVAEGEKMLRMHQIMMANRVEGKYTFRLNITDTACI